MIYDFTRNIKVSGPLCQQGTFGMYFHEGISKVGVIQMGISFTRCHSMLHEHRQIEIKAKSCGQNLRTLGYIEMQLVNSHHNKVGY